MKKILSVLFSLVLAIMCLAPCLAAENEDIKIFVDGEQVISENAPVIENSRTLAPVRAVAEKAGIAVSWDGESSTVTLSYDFYTVKMTVGSTQMTVYNSLIDSLENVQLDTEPKIINSSTYITLRAALEAVGVKVAWDGDTRSIYVTSPDKITDAPAKNTQNDKESENNNKNIKEDTNENTKEAAEDDAKEAPAEDDTSMRFTGFREMENHEIYEGKPHGLYGRIRTDAPITAVRCRIVDTEYDAQLRFKASDNLRNYNVFTYFDKHIRFSDAGIGDHTLEIYATVEGGKPTLVFSYDYTVIANEESDGSAEENAEESDNTDESEKTEEAEESEENSSEEEIVPVISYSGFRKMPDDVIFEGAPHGLYGSIVSNVPLTGVRCRIKGTEMDYAIELDAVNGILSYNVFSYFDKLICFSDAGLGQQTFEIYAAASGRGEKLLFSYSYTVTEKKNTEDANEEEKEKEETEDSEKTASYEVCLPLRGEIELTSPYGFRAYNKWEFHKGIDIISDSLDIIAVADGVVVDCKTGINSGAGNYVALQHEGGWVSLYYHLKSYNVKKGDKVKMGQTIAVMGNSGGRYGVHLHFMTCDKWYGTLWATQNSHHTAPHEYVPQILSEVECYNPQYEKENKDKVIICDFNFPTQITCGKPYSISRGDGHLAFEAKSLESVNVTVTDRDGNVLISETEENPKTYTDGYYNYSDISARLDKLCKFDELPAGDMTIYISAVTEKGRERVVYRKDFSVVEAEDADDGSEVKEEAEEDKDTVETEAVPEDAPSEETASDDDTENGTESNTENGVENTAENNDENVSENENENVVEIYKENSEMEA